MTAKRTTETVTAAWAEAYHDQAVDTKRTMHRLVRDLYATARLGELFPLPSGEKFAPPRGTTGAEGVAYDDWETIDPVLRGNLGLRLADGVVGIDVDHYGEKTGADALAELEARLGALPPTYMSSRRGSPRETGTGIRFYRYSGGKLQGAAGRDIDVIQHEHRYAVVAPSRVGGLTYLWYDPHGEPMSEGVVPSLGELAWIPEAWEEHLRGGASTYQSHRADPRRARAFATALDERAEMCPSTASVVNSWLERLTGARDGGRYDTMLRGLHALAQHTGQGHSGWGEGSDALRAAWTDVAGPGRLGEFERAADGALAKATTDHHGSEPYGCTPDGCSALAARGVRNALASLTPPPALQPTQQSPAQPETSTTQDTQEDTVTETTSCEEHGPDNLGDDYDDPFGDDPFDDEDPFGDDPSDGDTAGPGSSTFDGGDDEPGDRAPDGVSDALVREKIAADLEMDVSKNGGARVAKSYANTRMIFTQDPDLRRLGRDEMGGEPRWMSAPSWRKDAEYEDADPASVSDGDLEKIAETVRAYFGARHDSLSKAAVDEAYKAHLAQNRFHPWRQYLEALPAWDGISRLERAIPTVEDSDYTRAVMRNFFLGMMSRVFNPGCQVDSMLVLWGAQGVRKSSFFRSLVPDLGYVAEIETVPNANRDKDELTRAHKSAIVVFDELDKLNRKTDQAALKAFLTARQDTWRAPYDRTNQTRRRSFVVAGTTNREQFLSDSTGNRRYWPLHVQGTIPSEALARDVLDQVLAEARDRYRAGERLNYGPEFEAMAEKVRGAHVDDAVRDSIYSWLLDPREPVRTVQGYTRTATIQGEPVDISRVSVAFLVSHVPELRDVDVVTDRAAAARIADAMDHHPWFERGEKPARVDGRVTKKWWELKPEYQAAEARVVEGLEQS